MLVGILTVLTLTMDPSFVFRPLEAEIYAPDALFAQTIGENVVFCSINDDIIVLTSATGKVLKSYDKQGPGPRELERPFFIGIQDDRILVGSNGNHVIVFNSELEIVELGPSLPTPALNSLTGISSESDTFLIVHGRFSKQGLGVYGLKNNEWQLRSQLFSHNIDGFDRQNPDISAIRASRKVVVAGTDFFYFQSGIMAGDDTYEIEHWTDIKNGPSHVLSLQAPADQFVRFRDVFSCFIQKITRTPTGYLVELKNQKGVWHDYFGKRGEFIRRERTYDRIISVSNQSMALMWVTSEDGQDDRVVPIDSLTP